MADVFDKQKRSDIMRNVKSKKNKSTELRLIEVFKKYHIIGWRRNYPVKGHPDFVFIKQRTAIFVDGCFWHGHNCRNVTPENNREFWQNKREKNKRRDGIITQYFESRGWKVIRIWECELKKKNENELIVKLESLVKNRRLLVL